jgi:uncharacterized RDD family membrane protein YckC
LTYAGFWKRFVATLIDGLITSTVTSPLYLAFANSPNARTTFSSTFGTVIGWLYYSFMESSPWQATLGKRAMGIQVTDLVGNRIDFGRATGRYFAKILSALTLGIGFLMAAFTKRKQALHDMVAGTLVVNQSRVPVIPPGMTA